MGDCGHGVDGGVYRSAGHERCQCCIALRRWRSRSQLRRQHLGTYLVPRRERYRLTHQRMARGVDWPQAVLHDVACYFYGEFTALRVSAESAAIAIVSSSARHRWRRTATDGASHSQRYVSSGAARLGVCCLRHYRSSRPDSRADAGRVDYRQLFMALDIFHHAARGPSCPLFDAHPGRRSAVPPSHKERGYPG